MKIQNDIKSYVSCLRKRLHLRTDVLERIITETEAHLRDRAAAHISSGMDQREAEMLAVAEFGPAWRVALRFQLAYLDYRKVIAWTGVILVIANEALAYALSDDPSLWRTCSMGVAVAIADVVLIVSFGLVVTAIFPRRRVLGAGLFSVAMLAVVEIPQIVRESQSFGSMWEGHKWNGWQSGFCARFPDALINQPHELVLHRDSVMLSNLLGWFAVTLIGVWAASAIRAKLARRELSPQGAL